MAKPKYFLLKSIRFIAKSIAKSIRFIAKSIVKSIVRFIVLFLTNKKNYYV